MKGFTDTIRRYAADNRYSGELNNADGIGEVGLGTEEAGRRIAVRFALQVRDGKISDLRYQVFGCGYSMAACAAAAELAIGASLTETRCIDAGVIDERLAGLPTERRYCADLAAKALQAALAGIHRDSAPVRTVHVSPEADHGPRVAGNDPLYRSLIDSRCPAGITAEDRHLFACLLTVAEREPYDTGAALGLEKDELAALQRHFFPAWTAAGTLRCAPATVPYPEINRDVSSLLQSHAVTGNDHPPVALWLARILAARAALPGHLWIAMGLFERPQLSAAIRRHLPAVHAANANNMRWKRFFFKTVCDLNGGSLCKTPNCGDCSDYALCFAEED